MQSTMNNNGEFTHNELQILSQLDDDVDLRYVNWPLVIPMLLQRQQLRLCMAIYRYDMLVVENTPCETLLASVMADCDIGNIEDISLTVRDAFGSMLFDTMQKCRPGLEIFGVRCRRRA
ncbi:uncharacterized protein LOC115631322 [Scaptodrosophila lebanonensis]|uniref:Uncharacterized protein LOC115631322 n=1 Tax=Drosophila lebanonensis TaxID=7225 RepID=A0A6J2U5Q9_DROLE|nr:uncharacterized protein LOC115631322 [Scaptodrosophila lebanonensis]